MVVVSVFMYFYKKMDKIHDQRSADVLSGSTSSNNLRLANLFYET